MSSILKTLFEDLFQCAWSSEAAPFQDGIWRVSVQELSATVSQHEGHEKSFAVTGTRGPWDDSREFDSIQLNKIIETLSAGNEVISYTAPLGGLLVERAIRDLKGFDSVDVFVDLEDEVNSDAIAGVAEAEWLGVSGDVSGELIFECLALEVPFQLTGVTSSPFTSSAGVGFVQAAGAVALAYVGELSPAEIQSLLQDRSHEAIQIGADDLTWRGVHVSLEQVREVRELLLGVVVNERQTLDKALAVLGVA